MVFESAVLKVERAKHHINDLERQWGEFIAAKPYSLVVKSDPQTGYVDLIVRLKEPVPTNFAMIIGDAIHNARAALDHLTWDLIGLDGGTRNRQTKLPTGDNRINYGATCNGLITPRQDTKDFFAELGIYDNGPGRHLRLLHLMDNDDKHIMITPLVAASGFLSVRFIGRDGSRSGVNHVAANINKEGVAHLVRMGGGNSVEIEDDSNIAPYIFFDKIEAFAYHPVIQTLQRLADAVRDVIGDAAEFVKTRPP